jgi:hypothetical protein
MLPVHFCAGGGGAGVGGDGIAAIQGQLKVLQGQMKVLQVDLIRARNASAHNDSDTLAMPPNDDGNLPAAAIWVPEIRLQLMGMMSGAQATELLGFYNQVPAVPVSAPAADADVDDRDVDIDMRLALQLAAFLGVRPS